MRGRNLPGFFEVKCSKCNVSGQGESHVWGIITLPKGWVLIHRLVDSTNDWGMFCPKCNPMQVLVQEFSV